MEGVSASWLCSSFVNCSDTYCEMLRLFCEHPQLAKLCVLCVTSGELDEFAVSVVDLLDTSGCVFPVFQVFLEDDSAIRRKGCSVDTRTATSKLCTAYARLIGSEYLQTLLSDFVTEIVLDENLDFEIQVNKLAADMFTEDDPRVLQLLQSNRESLTEATRIIINRIIDPKMMDLVPEELKELVKHVPLDRRIEFTNEFLIFKLISPAIVTPERYNLLPPDVQPSKKARRNLILMTNLLRKCGSGFLPSKGNYMSCANDFIDELHPKLIKNASGVIALPCTPPTERRRSEELSSTRSISNRIFHYDFSSLLDLHLLLDQFKQRILTQLSSSDLIDESIKTDMNDFLDVLCPAPYILTANKKTPPWRTRERSISYDPQDSNERIEEEVESSDLLKSEMASLDKAAFLFLGPNSKEGLSVLYLIANRFQIEFLHNVDLLITYVYQIISHIADSPYILVIDMSWTRIHEDMKRLLYKQAGQLLSVLDHKIRKNLSKVFIVHPSAYTRSVMLFLRQFTSSKLKAKITEAYNWESLQSDINKEEIALPETSKDFITKTYSVKKVNSKGKNQKRLIKFTMDSLLNIDPKTKRVQNEKKISDFAEVVVSVNGKELQIHFGTGTPSVNRRFGNKGSQEDRLHRKYIFDNCSDRDQVLLDIFRTGFYESSCGYPQNYKVVKVNKRGRKQDRMFKLTCDSLLNMDGSVIKSEISFAGIDSVYAHETKPNVVWLHYKAETKRRKIICKEAANLIAAISDGLLRYQKSDYSEMDFAIGLDIN